MDRCIVVFSVVILASFFHAGEGIKCYMCSSQHETDCLETPTREVDCDDPALKKGAELINGLIDTMSKKFGSSDSGPGSSFDLNAPSLFGSNSDSLLELPKVDFKSNSCLKYVVMKNGVQNVGRSCAFSIGDEDICKVTKKQLAITGSEEEFHCSTCTSDLCNSSTHLRPALITVFITAILSLYLKQ